MQLSMSTVQLQASCYNQAVVPGVASVAEIYI